MLEAGLQIGAQIAARRFSRVPRQTDKHGLRIICAGDSFTYGLGVPKEESYPAQLEEILRQRYPQLNIQVLNYGQPGLNSTMLAERMPQLIRETSADMAIVMIGMNDRWNLAGVDVDAYMACRKIPEFLKHLKTCKLFGIIMYNLNTALREYPLFSKLMPSGTDSLYKLRRYFDMFMQANACRGRKEYVKAEDYCQKCIELMPELGRGYAELSLCYKDTDRLHDAYVILEKTLRMVSSSEMKLIYLTLIDLAGDCRLRKDYDTALDALLTASLIKEEVKQIYDELIVLARECRKNKRDDLALKALLVAASIDCEKKEAYDELIILGRKCRKEKRYGLTLEALSKAVRINTDAHEAYDELVVLGKECRREKQYELTFQALLEARGIDGGSNERAEELVALGRECRAEKQYELTLESLLEARCSDKITPQTYTELDGLFSEWGGPEKAIPVYLYLKRFFPNDIALDLRLANMYKAGRDFQKARGYFSLVLERNPGSEEAIKGIKNADFFISQDLSVTLPEEAEFSPDIRRKRAMEDETDQAKDKRMSVTLCRDTAGRDFEIFNSEACRQKISDIIRICRQNDVTLLFSGYPVFVPDYVKKEADSNKVGFVNVKQCFSGLIREHTIDEYFVSDGHCTAKGYRIMAEGVADEVGKYIASYCKK